MVLNNMRVSLVIYKKKLQDILRDRNKIRLSNNPLRLSGDKGSLSVADLCFSSPTNHLYSLWKSFRVVKVLNIDWTTKLQKEDM